MDTVTCAGLWYSGYWAQAPLRPQAEGVRPGDPEDWPRRPCQAGLGISLAGPAWGRLGEIGRRRRFWQSRSTTISGSARRNHHAMARAAEQAEGLRAPGRTGQ
jgi:hypothetical protein